MNQLKLLLKDLMNALDTLSDKSAAWLFVTIGIVTFSICLGNPFMGDDIPQIVDNLPVHFIQNIGHFFVSSTFYNGQDLVGTYYRPLMTTTFSILYTLFETWTAGYHLLQISLFTAGSFVLYLVLRRFMKQRFALLLALFFMVHPMNSQIVFSIACMQDALMFFFGISSLYILITRQSWRSLVLVSLGLMLTLFAKESGAAYVVMAFAYLAFFDRQRIWKLAVVFAAPFALYITLKTIAVGLLISNAHGSPIGTLPLDQRLMTAPSIILFYFSKFVFPLQLATTWYWTEPTFTITGVLIPALIDITIVALFVWLGYRVKKLRKIKDFKLYIYFAIWAALGLVPYTQITPLDMTACETWFAFSMIGVLGMIGLALPTFKLKKLRMKPEWILLAVVILIAAFAIRTIERGSNYSSQYSIAQRDMAVSPDNYFAMNNAAQYMLDNGRFKEAERYALDSIAIFPTLSNHSNLGVAYQKTGRYDQAVKAYETALTYGSMDFVYENLAQIYLADWQDPKTEKFLADAIKLYPSDYRLLSYMAILKGAQGDNAKAKEYIQKAVKYGIVPPQLYESIMNNTPLTFELPVKKTKITIK